MSPIRSTLPTRTVVPALFAGLLALLSPDPAAAGSATYCIDGTSTGVGWAFSLECESGSVPVGGGGVENGAVPAGASCAVLAATFVDVVNVTSIGGWTASITEDPCCFEITNPDCPDGDIRLTVFTSGLPPCTVTPSNPCSFNPTVTQVTGPVSVDGSTWGSVKATYR